MTLTDQLHTDLPIKKSTLQNTAFRTNKKIPSFYRVSHLSFSFLKEFKMSENQYVDKKIRH